MMRSTSLKDYDHDKDIEKFSGDEPDAAMKFLEHDINGQDNAEARALALLARAHNFKNTRIERTFYERRIVV